MTVEAARDFIIDMTAFILTEDEILNIKKWENINLGKFVIIVTSREYIFIWNILIMNNYNKVLLIFSYF